MIDQLLDQLEGVRAAGRGYVARCPVHADGEPSLSINPGKTGWLIHCFGGCDPYDIMAHAGLSIGNLFYNYADTNTGSDPRLTARLELDALVTKTQGVTTLPTLHRMYEVAWHTLPREPRGFDVALGWWWDEVTLPYHEAMRYWSILRDGWLWDWMGPAWLLTDRVVGWRETTEWMHEHMDQSWTASR